MYLQINHAGEGRQKWKRHDIEQQSTQEDK